VGGTNRFSDCDSGLILNDFPSRFSPNIGNTCDKYHFSYNSCSALKLTEVLAKIVGIILASAVATTGRIVDQLARSPENLER